MRKLILKTAISIDGMVEGPGGSMDWLSGDDAVWQEMFKLLADVDTVLLGRVMSAGYGSYWRQVLGQPDQYPRNHADYARWVDVTRHIVFSRQLQTVDEPKREVMRDAAEDIRRLKDEPGKNLMVYGGANFAASVIDTGLVDEYHFVVAPFVLGGGKPLFTEVSKRRKLRQIAAKPMPSGAVWLSYKPA